MVALIANLPGRAVAGSQQARLICPSIGTLTLPWWPEEIENTGWAAGWAETERPGRAPLLTRSSDPLPSLRIPFTLRGNTPDTSVQDELDIVRALAAAKPVVQLMLGQADRGQWRIIEAANTETDWAANGEPSVVDVILQMRAASDASIPVGPIRKKPKR